MNEILLHSCCAPCSSAILEWMLQNNFRPILFYFNPNIFPQQEYEIRKKEWTRYAQKLGVPIIDGDYNHKKWLHQVAAWINEPERGIRCLHCFRMRLLATAQLAYQQGIERFATTLAASRWKNLDQITEAALWAENQVPKVSFYNKNWRKNGLQERRKQLLNENNFYNQTYCGCEFSIRSDKTTSMYCHHLQK